MISKIGLENIYQKFNRREYVHPDPLEFLYRYPGIQDREIVGMISSSLAYGRVAQILKSTETVLDKMGSSPFRFLMKSSNRSLSKTFSGFKHRFTTDEGLVSLMTGIKKIISRHGSLNLCFVAGLNRNDKTIIEGLVKFVGKLNCSDRYLIPLPEKRGACKRLNLFLRWMVRKDAVDPGGWETVPKRKLIVPIDTHMARIGRMLGATMRKTADMKMALEITETFKKLAPRDPVKYDFALTRFGIRNDLQITALQREMNG